ncbi:hypothetical protein H0H92_007002 [Tricholoma furcatifolium]|nr:hypothetical protein H0H92_007002 [Tricholoma furcatifolium]
MADKHKVVFEWPHTEPSEVIVTGSFNDWAKNRHLTKGPNGFTGTVEVPWDSKIAYKYIVDGVWTTHPDQPTEADFQGNINNMYTAPPQPEPESALNGNGKHAPDPAPVISTTGTFPQLVAHLADTVVAREGTSSALGYVASGLGAAIHNVVGVDPVNAGQIAIPTPLPTAATATEFDVPGSAVSADTPLSPAPASQAPTSEDAIGSETADASETIPTSEESGVAKNMEETLEQPEQSSHGAAPENGDAPVIAEEPIKTEEEPQQVPAVAVEEPSELIEKPTSSVAKPTPVEKEGVSEGLNVPPGATTESPEPLETPEAITPNSDLNPSSVLAPEETPVGFAAAEEAESHAIPASPTATLKKELQKLEEEEPKAVLATSLGPVVVREPSPSPEPSSSAPALVVSEVTPEPEVVEASEEKEETIEPQVATSASVQEEAQQVEDKGLEAVPAAPILASTNDDVSDQQATEQELEPKANDNEGAASPEAAPEEAAETLAVHPVPPEEVVPVTVKQDDIVEETAPVLAAEPVTKVEDVEPTTTTEVEPTEEAKPEEKPEVVPAPAQEEIATEATTEAPQIEPVPKSNDLEVADKVAPAEEKEVEKQEVESTQVPESEPVTDVAVPEPVTATAATEPVPALDTQAVSQESEAVPSEEAVPEEPVPEQTIEAPVTEAAPVPVSAIETVPTDDVTETKSDAAPVEAASEAEVGATPAAVAAESKPETAPVETAAAPIQEPEAPAAEINGHAQEATTSTLESTSAPAPVKEAFPSEQSPAVVPSPKAEEKAPARKKKSSIFGKIKHFFEGDKDKTKK